MAHNTHNGNPHRERPPEPPGSVMDVDGVIRPRTDASVSALDRGFLYGDGFFETTRIRSGRPMHLVRHMQRLLEACAAAGWQQQPDAAAVTGAVHRLIAANGVQDGYLRITASRGPHEGALCAPPTHPPTVVIEARSMALAPLEAAAPLSLMRSPYRRNSDSPIVGYKSLSYQDNLWALNEACRAGRDEVFFLNHAGHLAEGAITNLFWIKDRCVYTPSEACGLLPGITRRILLDIAAREGIPCRVGCFREEDLLAADEAFCTNSLRGVLPVREATAGPDRVVWDRWPRVRRLAELYSRFPA